MISKKVLIISSLCVALGLWAAVFEAGAHELHIPVEIAKALREGDAKSISKYFNPSVELIFSDIRGVYGKAQAEQILKNFFNNNVTPNGKFDYKNLHSAKKDNAWYYIGELYTGKGRYRVYIYMKDHHIYEMRIESND